MINFVCLILVLRESSYNKTDQKNMNTIIQNILVFTAITLAIYFLAKKYFWKKPSSKKSCGKDDGCGCH
jgi:hypothetical protein